jgi:hypothetical protein
MVNRSQQEPRLWLNIWDTWGSKVSFSWDISGHLSCGNESMCQTFKVSLLHVANI